MTRAYVFFVSVATIVVVGCAQDLSALAPFDCAQDLTCPDGFNCTAAGKCVSSTCVTASNCTSFSTASLPGVCCATNAFTMAGGTSTIYPTMVSCATAAACTTSAQTYPPPESGTARSRLCTTNSDCTEPAFDCCLPVSALGAKLVPPGVFGSCEESSACPDQ